MTTVDQKLDQAASKLQDFANRMARDGGLKAKLAGPLAEDADLIRKLKPSLVKARAKGQAPTSPAAPSRPQLPKRPKPKRKGGGPNPWLVVGIGLAAGVFLAKWIDWRGHAHPRD
jgi:hypothetical protein